MAQIKTQRVIFNCLAVVGVFSFFVATSHAVDPASVIVANARAQIGKAYVLGQPANKEWSYGGIFDFENWAGSFDCSGLVSYAGNLRRHYGTAELTGFMASLSWSQLQSGDLLWTSGHIMIFDSRVTVDGVKRLKVIEAIAEGVREFDYVDPEDENWGEECYLQQNGYTPYRFRVDSTPPSLNISGVTDGGVYSSPVTVGFTKSDDIESTPYAYGEYQGVKFSEKTFSEEGTYSIQFHAQDWVKQPYDHSMGFSVDFVPPTAAQINFKLQTVYAGGKVELWNGCSAAYNCADSLDGCILSKIIGPTCSGNPSPYAGNGNINSGPQNLSISGQLQDIAENPAFTPGGSSAVAHEARVYVDAIPNVNLRLKFNHSLAIAWNKATTELSGKTQWEFVGVAGGVINIDSNIVLSTQSVSVSSLVVTASNNLPIVVDGKNYYSIGWLKVSGNILIRNPSNSSAAGSYSSAIDNIQVRYIGKVISKLPEGDNQTGLVGQPLPKGLSIRVVDDETGLPVANEPITFAVAAPANGASLSVTSINTDLNGYATTYLTLGASTGTYSVSATCPGCVAGVNAANFTAMAISSFTDVIGVAPVGCTQAAIGDKVAQVDPITNYFRIFNVPLVINSPVKLLRSELVLTCNNDAECPVENAQRVPEICAAGNFKAARKNNRSHNGIDLKIENGNPIFSATEGHVIFIGQFNKDKALQEDFGWIIVIQSMRKVGDKYEVLLYAHLDQNTILVRTGDLVSVGQLIATASLNGASGNIREVLDGNPLKNIPAKPQCLHVHVERRLSDEPLATLGFPVPCSVKSNEIMLQCNNPDMNVNGNGDAFGNRSEPTNPDEAVGCNIYR